MSETDKKSNYHHGDLRAQLLMTATKMIRDNGIEQLSLRKLASEVGVSRTAPYHHFKDKNELLCAIAEQGFRERLDSMESQQVSTLVNSKQQLKQYMIEYVTFAQQNPEIYELMFGRTIWKQQIANQALKDLAYPSFQHQLAITKQWQNQGLLDNRANSLRLSQVIWGTMHGIAKLLIDGIYKDNSQLEEICECAAAQFSLNLD